MRKTLLTALGAVALLSAGAFANQASAFTAATPSSIGAANVDNTLVEKAAVVCGYYGCARVWPRYYGGYYRPYAYYRPNGWYGRRWYY
jgi:hypothetical protein